MGKHDSSITRVVPVFDRIKAGYGTDGSWLTRLLGLPAFGNLVRFPSECDFTITEQSWGDRERKLEPPVALLSWLIRHPETLAQCEAASKPIPQKRRELLEGSYSRMTEALSLLRNDPGREEKNWYTFEGRTQPDVFIETPSLMVVAEGKRTEPGPTTKTKWMPVRHQMIRHLDCAWEIRGKKQVIGFFIVEGKAGEEVPGIWREFAKEMTGAEAIASSLPHRGPSEQNEIASCFKGVTTWQRVCREFAINWSELPDEAPAIPPARKTTGLHS